MSKLRLEISMSVDGYVTASGVRPEEPMGDGGQQLHEWAFGDDERGREVLAESQRSAARVSPTGAPTTCRSRGEARMGPAPRRGPRRSSSRTARLQRCPREACTPSSKARAKP